MEDLDKAVTDFVGDRLEKFNDYYKDPGYINQNNELNNLMKTVKELLPSEKKNLVGELESAFATLEAIEQEYVYKLGFKDALKLLTR